MEAPDSTEPTGRKRGRGDEDREERKARLRRNMAARWDELRAQGKTLRRDVMHNTARRAFDRAPTDSTCRRCGITKDGHAALGRGPLEKHHVLPISEGGHPFDPANLFTLCFFCHQEWHDWWEGQHAWAEYLSAEPYRIGITRVREREGPFHTEGCQRCGIIERHRDKLRLARQRQSARQWRRARHSGGARGGGGGSRRTRVLPFEPVHRERDRSLLV